MIRSAGDLMIPIDTPITREQFEQIDGMIAWRRKSLAKCRMHDAEYSLWLMEEIEHIKALKEYNAPRFTA